MIELNADQHLGPHAESSGPGTPRCWALADTWAVAPGMVAFGIMLGVTVITTGADPIAELIGGPAIYGGSAQLAVVALLARGVALLPVIVTPPPSSTPGSCSTAPPSVNGSGRSHGCSGGWPRTSSSTRRT